MRAALRSPIGLALLLAAVWAGASWWREAQAERLGAEVAATARSGDIRMISSRSCAYCRQARAWFTAHRVPFDECFVETEAACAQAYALLQTPGTPVLLVRDQRVLGFSPQRIAAALR
ncbi:MAG TPA: glutaredoxin family protein [Methylibium sp.]|nr:glutaredoxin family protein [Methylibium sp.]